MLQPPTGDKRVPVIGDPRGGTPRPLASRKELRLLVFGLVGLFAIAMWWIRGVPAPHQEQIPPPPPVSEAMPAVDLAAVPALPDAALIAAARSEVDGLVRAGEVPAVGFGLDALAMAWAERLLAEDSERRRIPQRITASELISDQIRPGQLVVLAGELADVHATTVPGRDDPGYRWLALGLAEGQYAIALQPLAGAEDLTINTPVQVLGRYLGRVPLPTVEGERMVPVLATRVATALTPEGDQGRIREYQGAVPLVDDLYRDIDDERPLVESHPYYLTLGRVKTEMGTPEMVGERVDANRTANAIHQDPAAYRGKPVEVRGAVWHAWEDPLVSADQPFDVRRVVRILMYRRDIGPITEDGKTTTKSVLRIFELAAISDQPLPQPGDFVVASGRFLKWRAIPTDRNPAMRRLVGANAQSDRVFTMFIVSGPWRIEEPVQVDWTPLLILLSFGVFGFAGMVLWFVNRDRGAEQRMKASVAALRRNRRALRGPAVADPAAAPDAPAATEAPAAADDQEPPTR